MTRRPLATMGLLVVAAGFAVAAHGAETPREVHGSADTYAAPGVTLAWGVLRGIDEASTIVVLRIAADSRTYPAVAVAGIDPFTRRAKLLLPPAPTAGAVSLRVPRAHFAEFPRSEILLYGATPTASSATPQLTVFYLGVPDTTPEFASETALDAYLAERIARARATGESKPP